MSARPDLLDVLPFADVADPDPNALPFGVDPDEYADALTRRCDGCTAEPGEACRPWCTAGLR